MNIFISYPVLAFMPAMFFVVAYVHHRIRGGRGFRPERFVVLFAGCMWLLYALYEFSVQQQIKSENVPIRVDLLFLGPALLAITLLGFLTYAFGFPRQERKSS